MRFFLNDLFIIYLKSQKAFGGLWLYVLLGVLGSEALRYTSWSNVVRRACATRPVLAVVAATVVGAVSPLCTYGTVPVVAELVTARLGVAPVVAFLSSSSLMNPQLFAFTWGGIGAKMALARLFSVMIFGALLGLSLLPVPASWIVRRGLLSGEYSAKPGRPARTFSGRDYARRCLKTLLFVGKYLVIGIVAGAAIEVWVPTRWFYQSAIPGSFTGVLMAAAISVPLSACGGGAIPLVRSLMEHGMTQGSALAFFIVGPATRPSPLMALAAIVRPVAVIGYISALLAFSIALGVLYG